MSTIAGQASSYARRSVVLALSGGIVIISLLLIERSVFARYSFQVSQRTVETYSLAKKLTRAHERLMSAITMAALTAEQSWIDTYRASLPQAETALRAAVSLAPAEIIRDFEGATKVSYYKIGELGQRILDALEEGNLARAQSILTDPVYQYHKHIVAEGTARLADALIASIQADLKSAENIELALITGAIAISIIGALSLWWWIDGALTEAEDLHAEAENKIKRLAMHDTLTGLANRMAFHQGLKDAIERAKGKRSRVAVLMIDLDRFKPVNDRHGHLIGDLALKEVAARLRKVGRSGELRGRFGGDEFVAIVEYESDDNIPRSIGKRIVETLAEPIVVRGLTIEIGASVGIAHYPHDAKDAEDLISKADMALYRAKSDGRGAVRCFDPVIDNVRGTRGEIEAELIQAIKTRAIVPYYQPIISLSTGTLVGFQILARWHHPSKGLLLPDAFVKHAESFGLANDLMVCLVQKACLDMRALPVSVPISINISPQQIAGGHIVHKILAVASKTKFQPNRLEVELTEAALNHDLAGARDTISMLKNLGVRIVLGGFGAGTSSLKLLTSLPFDKIRIDRSVIRTVHDSPYAANAAKAIVGLGKSLGLPTIAEGIETTRDAEALAALGCTMAQGVLYSKPVPVANLLELVQRFSTPLASSAVA